MSAAAFVAAAALAGPAAAQEETPAAATTTTPDAPASTTPAPATPAPAAPVPVVPADPAAPQTTDLGTLEVQVAKPPPVARTRKSADQQRRQDAAKFLEAEKKALTEQQKQQQLDVAGAPFAGLPSPDLIPPVTGVPNVLIDSLRVPPFLLPIYQAAGVEYGIRWEVLAAINEIETDYGRNLSVSTAGALGWMQFMPGTWETYGVDANNDGRRDPYNPVDAIFAAARYLKAAGGNTDLQKAIFSYNHAQWYVDDVLARAGKLAALPTDVVGALTGLTMGRFPVSGPTSYANGFDAKSPAAATTADNASVAIASTAGRRSIDVYARDGSAAIAVQDGRVVRIGSSKRLGRFVSLRDVYGNTYTYGHLESVAGLHAVPRTSAKADAAEAARTPAKDPAPTAPATAGKRPAATASAHRSAAATATRTARPKAVKERLFANPKRVHAFHAGGQRQLKQAAPVAAVPREVSDGQLGQYLAKPYSLRRDQVVLLPLKQGSRVIAGTILGRVGPVSLAWDRHTAAGVAAARHLKLARAPHLRFEIRPSGTGAPRIDPTPILDGWHLLASTNVYGSSNPLLAGSAGAGGGATIGQILLMSKETLERRVLADPAVQIYPCGRQDIQAGAIDRRVLATLEFLAASGFKPTVSTLKCGHSYLTTSGNVSEHSSGNAVDIGAINGTRITPATQGPGSITDIVVRRLLTLQGAMKPHQIITLMQYAGTDNTLALADHDDHIHVGFQPLYGDNIKTGKATATILKPGQWSRLIGRIGAIQNPTVAVKPSKYALRVKVKVTSPSTGR